MNTIEEQVRAAVAGRESEIAFQRPSRDLGKTRFAVAMTLMALQAAGLIGGYDIADFAVAANEVIFQVTLH